MIYSWFTGLMIYFLVFFDGSIEVAMHNFRCKFFMMEVCVCFCKPFIGDFRLLQKFVTDSYDIITFFIINKVQIWFLSLLQWRCCFKTIIRLVKRRWQDLRPLPPIFCPVYSRSTSLLGWKFPVTDKIFLVLISISLISCIVPILGVRTGVAKA